MKTMKSKRVQIPRKVLAMMLVGVILLGGLAALVQHLQGTYAGPVDIQATKELANTSDSEEIRVALEGAKKDDTIVIAGITWYVMRTKKVNGVDYALLIMSAPWYDVPQFFTGVGHNANYKDSAVRSFINARAKTPDYNLAPLLELAVVPDLKLDKWSLPENQAVDILTEPTSAKASSQINNNDIEALGAIRKAVEILS